VRRSAPPRIETDSLGPVPVPAEAYWGASTQRALENFVVSGAPGQVQRFPRRFLEALGTVKRACAQANEELGLLDVGRAEWIAAAAQEVIDGRWDDQFPLDVFQTGSGTSTNMNANEVIANRAIELMGGTRGSRDPVHPNDHVNLGQSSNDVIPTTIHVAGAVALTEDLLPALRGLAVELRKRSEALAHVVTLGRTHLVDATPVTMGQVCGGWASRVEVQVARVERARDGLLPLALGGTAVGTGINRHPDLPARARERIADMTGLPFRAAADPFAAQAGQDAVVDASAALRGVAVTLRAIAEDVRLLASGPRAGLGELVLPALQPGSSIMPGKVNPVVPEVVVMAAIQVCGLDAAIGMAGQSGHLQLNTTLPLLGANLLAEVQLLAGASQTFARRCIAGLTANEDACRRAVEQSLGMATALAPTVGYDAAAEIAKEASRTGASVRSVARAHPALAGLTDAALDTMLDPRAFLGPHA
jgi:fumarate hydratase class II